MEISRNDSIIELTAEETEWFLDPASLVPAAELEAGEGLTYRNFRDKVGHLAREIYHENQLTVMIYGAEGDDHIAICAENGLVVQEPPPSVSSGDQERGGNESF